MGRRSAPPTESVEPNTRDSRVVGSLSLREGARLLVRAFGIACLVMALIVGGYLAWLWWGTGFIESRAQHQLREQIELQIQEAQHRHADNRSAQTTPVVHLRVVLPGGAVAILQIPRIHLDAVVVEGIETGDLAKGPGHYPGTADPWDEFGRVGIAGHRTTYGRPFWSLDSLRKGDMIKLITPEGLFRYEVTRSQVVVPTALWVLHQTENPSLVLTTCTPRFSASHRLVVFAERVGEVAYAPPVAA